MTEPIIDWEAEMASAQSPPPAAGDPIPPAETAVAAAPGQAIDWEAELTAPEPTTAPPVEPQAVDPKYPARWDDFLVQGLTLGFNDEATSAAFATINSVRDLVKGKSPDWMDHYDTAQAEAATRMQTYAEKNPKTALAAEFGGAALMAPAAGAQYIVGAKSIPGVMGRSALVGTGIGVIAGAGHAKEGKRAEAALFGGATGAVVGVAAPLAITGIAKAIEVGARLIPGAAKREAAVKVAQALIRDKLTPQQALTKLRQIGASGIIADVGDNLRSLAGAVVRQTGAAKATATKFLKRRQRRQASRIITETRKALGTEGGYYKRIADLMEARATASLPAYEAAYAARWAPQGATYTPQDFLPLLNSSTVKRIWSSAQRIVADEKIAGALPKDYYFPKMVKWAGGETLPDTRAIDYIKKALDGRIRKLFKSGASEEAMAAKAVRDRLKDIADDLNPLYKDARAAWAGPSQSIDALNAGRAFVSEETPYIAGKISAMTSGDREFFRAGVAQRIAEMLKSKKEGADKVAALLRTPLMREKLAATFESPAKFIGWTRKMLGEEKMHETFRLLGGSPTAERLSAAADFNDIASPGMLRDVLWASQGNPFAKMRLLDRFGNLVKGPPREAVAQELAPMFSAKGAPRAALLEGAEKYGFIPKTKLGLEAAASPIAASQSYRGGNLLGFAEGGHVRADLRRDLAKLREAARGE